MRITPKIISKFPSLRTDIPLNRWTSRIYCTDCHSGNFFSCGRVVQGPAGPHGSTNEAILALDYEFEPESIFNSSSGPVVFSNVMIGVVLFRNDSFLHRQHVLDYGNILHQLPMTRMDQQFYPHLLNFLVRANVCRINFIESQGLNHSEHQHGVDRGVHIGSCWLTCHGAEHKGARYPAPGL